MIIVNETIPIHDVIKMASGIFGLMIKAVVDIDREIIALDTQMHSDLESALMDNGSSQENLWGINIYPESSGDDFIEFDSMINIRPAQNNKSRFVEDENIRRKIAEIVSKRIIK